MASFTFTARDRSGAQRTGVVDARDAVEARGVLRDKDLFVTDLKLKEAEKTEGFKIARKKVKLGDMVVMSRQMATLVKAGLSIIECLNIAAAQTENSALSAALDSVRLDVMTGSTLADAMRRQPRVFSEQYVALVHAGESGGVLEQTLEIAAEQFDKEADLREKVKSAFVYPAVVLVASFGVVTFMLVFIVPVFASVYKQFKAELPPITQFLVNLSYVVVHYWFLVIAAIVAIVNLLQRFYKTPAGRRLYDGMMLKLPLLGKLNRKIAVSRFTQTFAGSVKAGVPILGALTLSANTSGNVVLQEAITKVNTLVEDGATLAAPLQQTGEFPPMVTRMVAAGEQSGNLDEMLTEITKFYSRDIEYTVGKLTRIMEPAMTAVVGAIVLFVLLALYMPIFNLTHVVRK